MLNEGFRNPASFPQLSEDSTTTYLGFGGVLHFSILTLESALVQVLFLAM
jgi:hypothetical protein